MALLEVTATPISTTAWRMSWTGSGTFYVYQNGRRISIQTDTQIDIQTADGAVPQIEVATASGDVPYQLLYPWRANLAWYDGDALASAYYVVQQDGTAIDAILGATREYVRWQSKPLADQTTYAYQIDPYATGNLIGESVTHDVVIARNPDDPNVTYSYDATSGDLTISAT
jgi:hypothetical protein